MIRGGLAFVSAFSHGLQNFIREQMWSKRVGQKRSVLD